MAALVQRYMSPHCVPLTAALTKPVILELEIYIYIYSLSP